MCRLFGLHAGVAPVPATFWLIDAPDSLAAQSHANPDGAGIGVFGVDGEPVVDKQPLAAWQDREFATAARDLHGTTFVAHVRYASTGGLTMANTHPFLMDGRLFAHNGVLAGLPALDERLAQLDASDLVRGDTDSERLFALVTAETRRRGGDVGAGIVQAIGWVVANLPLLALNFVLTTASDLWAFRYPDTHDLFVLDRPSGGTASARGLDVRSDRIHASAPDLAAQGSVVVATERMDDDPAWRPLAAGELLHVDRDLKLHSTTPFPAQPRHLLKLADLDATAAASQSSHHS